MLIPIYDSGHGYNTPGKRSEISPGVGHYDSQGNVLLKENCVNESVANKLSMIHYLNHSENYFISNEWIDISLDERVRREREIAKRLESENKKSFFMSLHADAFHVLDEVDGGRFFYKSEAGKKLAHYFTDYLTKNGYEIRLREPKYANFKLLRETRSTAILFEMGFMTTKSDLDILRKDSFRNKTAKLLYEAGQLCDL